MRITVNPVLDMETLEWVANDGVYDYTGPFVLFGGGGDPTAQAAEQSDLDFQNQLISIFKGQYANQTSTLNFLQGQLQPNIAAGGQGYTPEQLAAQRTSASDTNSQQFTNAQMALQNQISTASGGSKLTGVSGAAVQDMAALDVAGAQTEATSQNAITTGDANLQQQNYWAGINALNGVAAQVNPLGYASAASGASSGVAANSNANTNAITASNGPLNSIFGAVGGVAGALGGAAILKCHIFASFFGWDNLRTFVMRAWVTTAAPAWFRNFYVAYSKRIAKTPARWAFYPIAMCVLETA